MDGGAWWAAVHGVAKSRTWLSDFSFTFHFHALEKEMATHPSVLAWRIPGTGEPGGLPSLGSHRVRHDWSDLAAAAAAWILTILYVKFSLIQITCFCLLTGILKKWLWQWTNRDTGCTKSCWHTFWSYEPGDFTRQCHACESPAVQYLKNFMVKCSQVKKPGKSFPSHMLYSGMRLYEGRHGVCPFMVLSQCLCVFTE